MRNSTQYIILTFLIALVCLRCTESSELPDLNVLDQKEPDNHSIYLRETLNDSDSISVPVELLGNLLDFLNYSIDTAETRPYLRSEITDTMIITKDIIQITLHKYTHGFLIFEHQDHGVLFAGRIWNPKLNFTLLSLDGLSQRELDSLQVIVRGEVENY